MTQQAQPPKKKMPRPPPGPPNWVEGPQLPTAEELAKLKARKQQASSHPTQKAQHAQ